MGLLSLYTFGFPGHGHAVTCGEWQEVSSRESLGVCRGGTLVSEHCYCRCAAFSPPAYTGRRDCTAASRVRLQVECFRDEYLREQLCFIGRCWSLTKVSIVKTTNGAAIGALSPKTANQAEEAIADLELHARQCR